MAHIPVLLKEVIDGLELKPGMIALDGTLGGAGHSKKICEAIGKDGILIGIDQDKAAIARAEEILKDSCKFHLFVSNFRELSTVLQSAEVPQIDVAMFDLGLSSFQLEDSKRGFTFLKDEPLIMTFEETPGEGKLTAREIVNEWAEESLADIIYGYGGERYARRIARVIVEERGKKPIETTFQLISAIEKAVPTLYKKKRIHFATKTFQALRITVNDEIGSLRKGLEDVWSRVSVGGRIAVISFHEIEDRTVKTFFRSRKEFGDAELITKKPIVPGEEEILDNPRSRSAKLRIVKKINASM
ncbi:MAG: ribosomal RNA small subunit methyltransferase H [Parcubacteria group bacterium GW2011_GWF2_38_76]|nr:MAG: ribosomal RNA small subunit methyltransferase H [Parcubacteria group bacterium GW2011_GWF2_38_76]HBM46081.1 16S rRNA (cytosine(1402)-N(4))-methyltransferase [Patescibacteria group bacterium]